ncbi:YchF family ATPase [bacterium]|nr:YchF family ATPase [bacterium]
MRIAIIGFSTSGKTTVFNALTGQAAATSAFSTGRAETHHGIVKVPDARLDKLTELFKPKKHTPATVEYLDLAAVARQEDAAAAGSEALGEKQMAEIANSDALLAVVRGFVNAAGDPPAAAADIEAIALEMALSDLKKVETRVERIDKQIQRAPAAEKRALQIELDACRLVQKALEEGKPARAVTLDEEQRKSLRGFQLLTLKPTMFLVNDGEEQWKADGGKPVDLGTLAEAPQTLAGRLSGQMEMEIAQLPPEDREAFLADYGIAEPAAHRVIRMCYELLGQISFFTVGPDECRAWTIRTGTTAQPAAGAIHSDLERGFIRAEVIRWDELLAAGSYAEAKKHGKLRLEGKDYTVQDGDIMNILFSV